MYCVSVCCCDVSFFYTVHNGDPYLLFASPEKLGIGFNIHKSPYSADSVICLYNSVFVSIFSLIYGPFVKCVNLQRCFEMCYNLSATSTVSCFQVA